eukprot:GEMP01087914.1.p1 GENE.GEMP01087914.1~~GEMP01087914.1.p1  ORF type:complete len:109 (-),score=10.83 GEMP01087914.1:288-614(-)
MDTHNTALKRMRTDRHTNTQKQKGARMAEDRNAWLYIFVHYGHCYSAIRNIHLRRHIHIYTHGLRAHSCASTHARQWLRAHAAHAYRYIDMQTCAEGRRKRKTHTHTY